jgi:hypothetical protein
MGSDPVIAGPTPFLFKLTNDFLVPIPLAGGSGLGVPHRLIRLDSSLEVGRQGQRRRVIGERHGSRRLEVRLVGPVEIPGSRLGNAGGMLVVAGEQTKTMEAREVPVQTCKVAV